MRGNYGLALLRSGRPAEADGSDGADALIHAPPVGQSPWVARLQQGQAQEAVAPPAGWRLEAARNRNDFRFNFATALQRLERRHEAENVLRASRAQARRSRTVACGGAGPGPQRRKHCRFCAEPRRRRRATRAILLSTYGVLLGEVRLSAARAKCGARARDPRSRQRRRARQPRRARRRGAGELYGRRTKVDRNLALELVRGTEAAALAAGRWMTRGDPRQADAAAFETRRALLSVKMRARVRLGRVCMARRS